MFFLWYNNNVSLFKSLNLKGDFFMEMKKLFSFLTSFMFLFVPVISKAMIEVEEPVCIICNDKVPEDNTERIKTECGCEFCKDHLIEWWEAKEKEANDEDYEFLPLCPRCHEVNSVDFYTSILDQCAICLKPMSETIMTKCKHKFCKNCLNKWLDQKNTCPMCRTKDPCNRGQEDLPEENDLDVEDFDANLRELNRRVEIELIHQRRQEFEYIHDEAIPEGENKEKTLGNKFSDFAKDNSFLCALLLGGATTVYLGNLDGANDKPTDEEYDGLGSDFDYFETGLVREDIKTES